MTMNTPSFLRRKTSLAVAALTAVIFTTVPRPGACAQPANPPAPAAAADATVDLTSNQLNAITIAPLATGLFPVETTAVGNIDFNEDLSVQVFPSYQGKVLKTFAELGDDVQLGQTLYTIDSPDLVQAEATLIGAAATVVVTSNVLARASDLYLTNGVSKAELEQDVAAEATAEGALKAARDAVRIFGKTGAEIDQIAATGKIDPVLQVLSPLTGRVTAKTAPPGYLVQPGNAPAPYAVADLTVKWLLAYVSESDSPALQAGQPLQAMVMALPGRLFDGKISKLGATVDPNTHRILVRCVLTDPKNELTPGMLASFKIQVQAPVESVAIPMNGVVRNGDGTFAAWVTTDHQRFFQRYLKLGLQHDGHYQVLEGLRPGELAVVDGAVFLSNILYAPPSDD